MSKKKFEFKLNAEAPGQHMVILAVAFVFIWLSVIESIKGPSESGINEGVKGPYALTGETLYQNPQMTWYEKIFCRGYQRSALCSYRTLHPFVPVWNSHGIFLAERPPKQEGVVNCRGPMPANRAFHSKIVVSCQ